MFAQHGDLSIDLGITDEADGRHVIRVWKLAFEVDGGEAPAGYQLELPGDTYAHLPARLSGIELRVASPLALYQIRAGIAAKGSFGELAPAQRASLRKLRETFFPGSTQTELEPRTEPLATT